MCSYLYDVRTTKSAKNDLPEVEFFFEYLTLMCGLLRAKSAPVETGRRGKNVFYRFICFREGGGKISIRGRLGNNALRKSTSTNHQKILAKRIQKMMQNVNGKNTKQTVDLEIQRTIYRIRRNLIYRSHISRTSAYHEYIDRLRKINILASSCHLHSKSYPTVLLRPSHCTGCSSTSGSRLNQASKNIRGCNSP